MKKILFLISSSFLLFSCQDFFWQNTPATTIVNSSELESEQQSKYKTSSEFVQGSEDIPLLVGMEKLFDDSLGFDSASGSIMSSSYETKDSLSTIKEFYLSSLPALGWKVTATDEGRSSFKRENEKLEIEFSFEGNHKIVRFFLSSSL
jgi:hypothetical protein